MVLLIKYKSALLYGISLAALLILLKRLEWHFFIVNHALDLYIGSIALVFTTLGIWLASKLINPKPLIIEKTVYLENQEFEVNSYPEEEREPDIGALEKWGLSKRELEVLNLMAKGYSNQEIAEALFVSLNTVKTHSSKVFEKLDVKRRTQAVEKAKRLKIIC
ncbi:helix-turn-helix transcriptional regulator [Sphingobacteriaceae bacterium]|nr:helix-turn-helix transcriptional regulator [Sphingobacteriaceae bacterium]